MGNKSAKVKDPEAEKQKEAQKTEEKHEKGKHPAKPETKMPLQIIRVAETDMDGSKSVREAVKKVRGISHMLAHSIAHIYKNPDKKLSEMTEIEIKELEDFIANLSKQGIPKWQFNRRSDPDTGEAQHLIASQLQFVRSNDINKMKKMKSYKGVRHSLGQPVRGQRTRSSFRVAGKSVGVVRAKQTKSGAASTPAPTPAKKK